MLANFSNRMCAFVVLVSVQHKRGLMHDEFTSGNWDASGGHGCRGAPRRVFKLELVELDAARLDDGHLGRG